MKLSRLGSLIILLKKGKWNFHTQETHINKSISKYCFFFYFIFNMTLFLEKDSIWFVLSRKRSIILMSIFVLSLLRQMFCPICQHKPKGFKILSSPIFVDVYSAMCSLHILSFCHMCLSDDLKVCNYLVAFLFEISLPATSI